jgi:tetratricopeptide (TPR) repeat protein
MTQDSKTTKKPNWLEPKRSWLIVGVFIFGVLLFLSCFRNDFVTWDDDLNIYTNKNNIEPSFSKLVGLWTGSFEHFFTPLTYSAWMLISILSPEVGKSAVAKPPSPDPILFHSINVLMHSLCGVLIFLILTRLLPLVLPERLKDNSKEINWAGFFGALLFLCHPLQVESVAWASGLRDLLCSFFALSSILSFISFRKNKQWQFAMASIACFVLSCLSKATGAAIAPMILFIDWYIYKTPRARLLKTISPYVILAGVYTLITLGIQSSDSIFRAPLVFGAMFSVDSVFFYIRKLLVPVNMMACYMRTPKNLILEGWLPYQAVLAIWCVLQTRYFKPDFRRVWIAAWGLFFLPILPVSGIVPFISMNSSNVFDRYVYLPMLGVGLLLAWVLVRFQRKWVFAGTGCLIFCFSILSVKQQQIWKGSEELYTHAIGVDPVNTCSYKSLSLYYMNTGRMAEAKRGLLRIIEIDKIDTFPYEYLRKIHPDFKKVDLLVKRSNELRKKGDKTQAKKLMLQAHTLNRRDYVVLNNLGLFHAEAGNLRDAMKYFQKSIDENPTEFETYLNLSQAHFRLGEVPQTVKVLKSYIDLVPDHPKANAALNALRRRLSPKE